MPHRPAKKRAGKAERLRQRQAFDDLLAVATAAAERATEAARPRFQVRYAKLRMEAPPVTLGVAAKLPTRPLRGGIVRHWRRLAEWQEILPFCQRKYRKGTLPRGITREIYAALGAEKWAPLFPLRRRPASREAREVLPFRASDGVGWREIAHNAPGPLYLVYERLVERKQDPAWRARCKRAHNARRIHALACAVAQHLAAHP
jgi:hypothetical protein